MAAKKTPARRSAAAHQGGRTVATVRVKKAESRQRRYLTEAQLEMTCTELMDHLRCSKATAWRAKRRGYYCPGYNGNASSRESKRNAQARLEPLRQLPAPGRRVRLTAVELRLSRNALADRYRIGHALASEALRQGAFRMPTRRRDVAASPSA